MIERYRSQVQLLLRILPIISEVEYFALKGGTAINFFWRDLPRLSVDIDITYLPLKDRIESLNDIKSGLQKIADKVRIQIPNVKITAHQSGGTLSKLLIRNRRAQIKLEVNTVLRGYVYKPVEKAVATSVQDEFELFAAIQTLSFEDLYGGKLCAALDRQHPRDLFDVKLLMQNESLTERIRTAFIVYLVSHSRPIHEVLDPNPIDLHDIFVKEFNGMTNEEITLNSLLEIQKELPGLLLNKLNNREKEFLLSFQQNKPKWDSIPIPHLEKLPGVRWKLLNIRKMPEKKHQETRMRLEKVLLNNH